MRNIGVNIEKPEKTCEDKFCPYHGTLGIRGKIFEGNVVSVKGTMNTVIERELTHYISKYKRYEKRRSKIRAHLPPCIDLKLGQKVTVGECRPLTKNISFVVIGGSN